MPPRKNREVEQTDEGMRVAASSLKVGDRIQFRSPGSDRRVAREVVQVQLRNGQVDLQFRNGRGRIDLTIPADQKVLLPNDRKSRLILA